MPRTITLVAEESANLDTTCYRGTAPLCDLTRLSQVDVFDQVTNPDGLQRDLSKKHAAEAYAYAAAEPKPERPRAYPEIMLNVRDPKVVKVRRSKVDVGEGASITIATLELDLDKIDGARTVKVSRVDGNHRLFFGNGDGNDRGPLDVPVPFSITVGLTRDQERSIFTDVNAEQKGLNTSHLEVMRARLTPEELDLRRKPERVFAMRLVRDEASPWHELVHLGGSKAGSREAEITRPVTFVALEQGVRRILRKSQYIADLSQFDAQYGLIRNYWRAVQLVFREQWNDPRTYLLLKNLGVSVLSQVGATVIDRCMAAQQVDVGAMAGMLDATKDAVDWHADSPDVVGMSGNRAALALAAKLIEKMPKTPPAYNEYRDQAPKPELTAAEKEQALRDGPRTRRPAPVG